MGIVGGTLGYKLLRALSRDGQTGHCEGMPYQSRSKLEVLFGPSIWQQLADKVVVDFGCGRGEQAIEMADHGARAVVGVDMRENVLVEARAAAERKGVGEKCRFTTNTDVRADVVVSMDAFEHFADPAGVLSEMRGLINEEGCALIVFGPTWYHPLGGHLFSVFPWAHLVFTEKALIRWRSDFKTDGATRFHEVEGGLNQMTIKRFEGIVAQSDFEFASFEAVPIRKLRPLANRVTREFTTAVVRCQLVPRKNNP